MREVDFSLAQAQRPALPTLHGAIGLGRLLGKDPLKIDLAVARRGGMEAQQLRAAANAPIQGSSADIIKVAMVRIQEALKSASLDARMILQVHDELVFDVPKSEVEAVTALVRQHMEGAVELAVPLEVEVETGAHWLEAH